MAVELARGLGQVLWKWAAQPTGQLVTDTNRTLAGAAKTLAEPWAEAGSSLLGGATRRAMIPHPVPLSTLSKNIATFVAIKQKTQADVHALRTIIHEQGLDAEKETLLEQFPNFREEDVDKLIQVLQRDLQQTFDVEEGRIFIPASLNQSLKEIETICAKYGADTDTAVHALALQQLNQGLNGDASPKVKKAHAVLMKLLSLPGTSTPDQRQSAMSQVILHLDPLISDPLNPFQMRASDKAKIQDLMIELAPLLDEPGRYHSTAPIRAQVEAVHIIVQSLHDSQQGLVPRTFDNIAHRLAEVGTQVKEVFGGLLPGAPSPPIEAASGPDAPAGAVAADTPLTSILAGAKGWFNSFVLNAENALSRQAARGLATVLEYSFTFLKDHLSSNVPQGELVKDAIGRSIQGLQEAQRTGTFVQITDSLRACFDEFAKHEVYLQNMRVPFKPGHYKSVDPDYLEIAKSLEERSNKEAQVITPMMVEQMASRFKERSSFFISMKVIERLFGIKVQESEYAPFLNQNADIPPSAYSRIFRTQYFKCIDKSSSPSLVKWVAKCLYVLVQGCTSLFLHSIIDSIKSDFDDWRKEDIKEKGTYVIGMARNIFAVISGTYRSVAQTEAAQEKDIFLLLGEAVRDPQRNAGLKPEKFYGALVKTALKFVRFNWTKKVGNYFNECLIPSHSAFAFLNPFLDAINFFCKKALQALLYIPQTIFNFLLQKITGFLVLRSVKFHTLVDEHIDQLRDPLTPTSFSLHVLIENRIQAIKERVRERITHPDAELENIPTPDVQIEIATCVNIILEVLQKSRKYTVEELRLHDRADRTVLERIQRELQGYALPQARLPIATTLWAALQETLDEKSLLEMEYNVFEIANKMYSRQETVTPQQFHAVDKGIGDLADELIDVLIQKILDDKLDLNNTRQQLEISKFTAGFKTRIQGLVQNIRQNQQKVASGMTPDKDRGGTVKELATTMHTFIIEDVEASRKAGINDYLHQGTNSQINELRIGLKDKIDPIAVKIKAMKDLQEDIDAHETAIETFSGARSTLRTLEYMLSYPQEEDDNTDHFAAVLDSHIADLRRQALHDTLELEIQHNRFKEHHAQVKTIQSVISHLQTVESHFDTYLALKQQQGNQNTILSAYRDLIRLIHLLPPQQQGGLLAALSPIQQCMNPDLLEELSARFNIVLKNECMGKQKQLQETRMELSAVKETMELHLNKDEQSKTIAAQKKILLLQQNREMEEDIDVLAEWENNVRDITIIMVNFVAFMHWVQNTVHSLAVSETKKIVAEVRDVLFLPFVYTCMVNQLGVKFLERYGKEHIKNK